MQIETLNNYWKKLTTLNLKNRPRQYLYNYITLVIGLFILTLSILFLLRQSIVLGLTFLLLALALISIKKVIELDFESKSINVYSKLFLWQFDIYKYRLEQNFIKVILKCIINEQFGINRKSSTFYAYDVILVSNNNRKTKILSTVNENNAEKTSKFLSINLKIDIEQNRKTP